jgi:hypothetical protein
MGWGWGEKMQMRKQRQQTTWGTGMNPTGRYAPMFEGKKKRKGHLSKTTEIFIKKE